MEHASSPGPGTLSSVLASLEASVGRPAEETADVIGQALSLAAHGGPSDLEADRAALQALGQAPSLDRILERLDLPALAALAERCSERLAAAGEDLPPLPLRRMAWEVLDLVRRPSVLRRIAAADRVDEWSSSILSLVERSHLTVGQLFRRRADAYGSKPLFEIPSPVGNKTLTWRQVSSRVEALALGLLSLSEDGSPAPVGILSENRLETALADLACFTAGLVSVLVPATSTPSDVAYMLRHARARTLIVSDREQLEKVLATREGLPELRRMVVIEPQGAIPREAMTLQAVASRSMRVSREELLRRTEGIRIDDLATTMYTSGTTGSPKGIQFSHRNIVFKRFARALALPEVGEQDVFLCYLPLYHTFGRFLELLGCVFWGATYCFLENPSAESLVQGMQRHRPTVFISVPKKWIQLYEAIAQAASPEGATDAELLEATRRITGGRLRWGLSAAGHLSPEIFRFFQRQGTELMSGFGMTEATGGITMTPPGRYKDDSLGPRLPGIELRLAEDGELLIRGPYVMMGYLDPPDAQPSFDPEGWLRSGDLMEMDPDGFLHLVDRKKEIYKNIKGETIAPQRVENLFRDFESVRRIFLVGDHREYNTALIYPNPDYREAHLKGLSPQDVKAHYRSLVVSVNKFLAPYERIVDFAIIDRDLDAALGELTPKLTPRRTVVERNFAERIRLLYRRADLHVGAVTLTFPNWLFQALGLTAADIQVGEEQVSIPSTGTGLTVRSLTPQMTQVGSCIYRHPPGALNVGVLLSTPRLWLGNEELVEFVALDLRSRERPGRAAEGIEWSGRKAPFGTTSVRLETLRSSASRAELDPMDLHHAALGLASADEGDALTAVHAIERALGQEEGPLAEPARLLLSRAAMSSSIEVRRRAFQILVPAEREARFPSTLRRFLDTPGVVLDPGTRAVLCEKTLPEPILDAFLAATLEACLGRDRKRAMELRAASLLRFLSAYGAAHPARYRRLRAFLVRTMFSADRDSIRQEAERAVESLRDGFREWLGPAQRIAVDPETGQEYRWEDVVVFEEGVQDGDRRRLLSAIKDTGFLREAVFLFSAGVNLRLGDIPPGGVSVRHLGTKHGKSVYRVTVQTRGQDSHDLAANVNHSLTKSEVQEEIHWLILCGESAGRDPLVEEFGGYWAEQDLWSEEFVAGETLARAARRLSRHPDEQERLRQMWPFFAWSALAAYVDFWNRTGRRREISDPTLTNVIVPTHDYHTGARIVSISARRPHAGLIPMIRSFQADFVEPAEAQYPALRGLVGWDVIFSSVLEVVGEEEGLHMFRELLWQDRGTLPADLRGPLDRYVTTVEGRGFLPMRLFFAAKRYRRWAELSPESTPQARARTLQDLYDTYGLQRLAQAYPEVRARFFRETAFLDAAPELATGLEEIIRRLRRRELVSDQLLDAISELRARVQLGPDEDYFLARLSFPHLRPEDAARFVRADLGGRRQSEIVVALEDQEGNPYRVRHALNPREVAQLHRLFLAAKLDVRFRPEHQYLVAIHERGQIIAGIFYEVEEEGRSAHLEKIVVAERYRKKGVADGLMNEFFNRMRAAGVKTVTTGFFRPEYFYAYGFRIEKRYAGLVKSLEVS